MYMYGIPVQHFSWRSISCHQSRMEVFPCCTRNTLAPPWRTCRLTSHIPVTECTPVHSSWGLVGPRARGGAPIALHCMQTAINQSINQSSNQSVNQSINQSISQSINQSINQSVIQSVNQSLRQTINQSINHSISQSINSPINQTINH